MRQSCAFDIKNRLFVFYLQQGQILPGQKSSYTVCDNREDPQVCFTSQKNRAYAKYPTIYFAISSNQGKTFTSYFDIGQHSLLDQGGNITQIHAFSDPSKDIIYIIFKNELGFIMCKSIIPSLYTINVNQNVTSLNSLTSSTLSSGSSEDCFNGDNNLVGFGVGGINPGIYPILSPIVIIDGPSLSKQGNEWVSKISQITNSKLQHISIGYQSGANSELDFTKISFSAYVDRKGVIRLWYLNPQQTQSTKKMRIGVQSLYQVNDDKSIWKSTLSNINFFGYDDNVQSSIYEESDLYNININALTKITSNDTKQKLTDIQNHLQSISNFKIASYTQDVFNQFNTLYTELRKTYIQYFKIPEKDNIVQIQSISDARILAIATQIKSIDIDMKYLSQNIKSSILIIKNINLIGKCIDKLTSLIISYESMISYRYENASISFKNGIQKYVNREFNSKVGNSTYLKQIGCNCNGNEFTRIDQFLSDGGQAPAQSVSSENNSKSSQVSQSSEQSTLVVNALLNIIYNPQNDYVIAIINTYSNSINSNIFTNQDSTATTSIMIRGIDNSIIQQIYMNNISNGEQQDYRSIDFIQLTQQSQNKALCIAGNIPVQFPLCQQQPGRSFLSKANPYWNIKSNGFFTSKGDLKLYYFDSNKSLVQLNLAKSNTYIGYQVFVGSGSSTSSNNSGI